MNKKVLGWGVFAIVALLQLYVPASMIFEQERLWATGKEFKFKTAPIDPTDPFRGKYITLNFEANEYLLASEDVSPWFGHERVYVHLKTDPSGYAAIAQVSKEKPDDSLDYVQASIMYVSEDTPKKMVVSYPFDRFYMEESKAYEAELAYHQSLQDTSQVTYALVSIKGGAAVIKDVRIDDVSIQEIVTQKK